MICKNCGNEIAEGNQFCENCGTAVEIEEVIVAEAAPEATTNPGKTFGIVALICGIASVVLPCIPCLSYIAFIPTILALVFGFIGMSKSKAAGFKNTLALVGVILAFCGIAVFVVSLFLGFFIGLFGSLSNSAYYY